MATVGAALRRANVGRIYLAHGTSAGTDPLGLAAAVGRVSPAFRQVIEGVFKGLVDGILQERGNYTGRYAALMERALNAPVESSEEQSYIEVRRFLWSGENHHLGRADAAIRLIDTLDRERLPAGQRVLLIGHSHAGNLFALLTQLVTGNTERVAEFFAAARVFYRPGGWRTSTLPPWGRVERLLSEVPRPFATGPLNAVPLDIVTIGTPVRYGWDMAGCARLLNFVFHYPHEACERDRALFPPLWSSLSKMTNGDFTQQIGIAGTNFMPPVPGSPVWLADRRLARVLEGPLDPPKAWARWKCGVRVPDAGATLLVDYGLRFNLLFKWTGSHTFYTHPEWLLWHLEEIARRWYNTPGADNE